MNTKLFDMIGAVLCSAHVTHDRFMVTRRELVQWQAMAGDLTARLDGTAKRSKDMEVTATQLADDVMMLRKEIGVLRKDRDTAQNEHTNVARQRNELEQVVQQRNGEIARLQKERDDALSQRDNLSNIVGQRNYTIGELRAQLHSKPKCPGHTTAQPGYVGSAMGSAGMVAASVKKNPAQEAIDRAMADGTWLKSPELIHYVLNEANAK